MARPVRPVDLTPVFDPLFLANFSLVGAEPAPGRPPAEPSAHDAALALGIIGTFTKRPFNFGANPSDEDVKRLAMFKQLVDGAAIRQKMPVYDLLRQAGVRGTERLADGLDRLTRSAINGQTFIPPGGWDLEHDRIEATLCGPVLTAAHPAKHPRSRPIHVDLAKVASFRCRHSAPVYLRALAWFHGGYRSDTPDLLVAAAPNGNVVASMPAAAIPRSLGLDMFRRFVPGELTPVLKRIARDLDAVSIGAEFTWSQTKTGRNARLRIEIGHLAPRVAATTRPLRPATNPYAGEVIADADFEA